MSVAGVDGTKGGWVAIVLRPDGSIADAILPLETAFAELGDVDVVAVDVPIGFGPRRADAAARAFMSGAASTVFTTPPREILEGPFGPGLGVSAQAHALGPRILRVTELAARDDRLVEVHPEVSFRAMNDCRPLAYRKKSAGGALERLDCSSATVSSCPSWAAPLPRRSTTCSTPPRRPGAPGESPAGWRVRSPTRPSS